MYLMTFTLFYSSSCKILNNINNIYTKMSLTIDSNVMRFKQGNKPNEWWLASKIDVEFIEKLINVISLKYYNMRIIFLN